MHIHPNQYNKKEFIENFLKKNNVNDTIISKFVDLPEKIIVDDHEYEIYINVTFFNIDDTFYNFELNYYSEEHIEFLFNSKVFQNVNICINYLMCELIEKKHLIKKER